MDQGDNQASMIPSDWDIDLPFLEDDWSIGLQTFHRQEKGVNGFPSLCQSEPSMHSAFSNHHHSNGRTWSAASNNLGHNTTSGSLVEVAQSPTSVFQQVYPVVANVPSIITQNIFPVSDTSWAGGCQSDYRQLSGPSEATDQQLLASNEDSQTSNNTTQPHSSKRVSKVKTRLACSHAGCKLTFARKYELERHRTTIHDCNVSIVCSVYGCNRIAKPFPRLDKFYEHVRKHHKSAERFLCVVESCRQGPLNRAELVQHLNGRHSVATLEQADLDHSLNSLNLRRQFRNGIPILLDNINVCPLRFLGCAYSHVPHQNLKGAMVHHLQKHELLERSKGYEKTVEFLGFWQGDGVATCPICETLVCKEFSTVSSLIDHVDAHTKEELVMYAGELAQMFRPYLTGQERIQSWLNASFRVWQWTLDDEFRARCEEVGVLLEIQRP